MLQCHMYEIALTYDDILLKPLDSEILPTSANLSTQLTKNIKINLPIISAAMDTVTESQLAISMAREGAIGVIHKNLSIEEQAREVEIVKRAANGVIVFPETMPLDATLEHVKTKMQARRVSSFPIIDDNRIVKGIITNRDLRFELDLDKPVSDFMSRNLVTIRKDTSQEEIRSLFSKHKIEKLVITDKKGRLEGLVCIKDILDDDNYPLASKDSQGRLRVGAACGTGEKEMSRVEKLISADVDLIVIDTAHGHHKSVIDMVRWTKKKFPKKDVIAGNIATARGAKALIDAGCDGVKVGIGAGSICTTRVVTGVGVPQASAIIDSVSVAKDANIPIIADGGIKNSGDIVKALSLGSSSVMLGSILAGTAEAPGDTFLYNGATYKSYRGMGSLSAMKLGSKDRYFQSKVNNSTKLIPEGVEGAVPLKGPLSDTLFQMIGGLRAAMGYIGAKDLKALRERAEFSQITKAGLSESHVHDVKMTKEAPNYNISQN